MIQSSCRTVTADWSLPGQTCNLCARCQRQDCREMKKFELHLDALITIAVVLVLAVGFIVYQRHQYSKVMQENIDLTWEIETLKVDFQSIADRLDACTNGN
jgi:hypothetical protein